jgi:hypothetical protein
MAEERVQSQVRLSTPRWAALRSGQVPVFFVAFVTSGLLWGTGHDLPSEVSVTAGHADLRTGIAWLAAMAVLLALAFPMLSYAVDLIRGVRPRAKVTRRYVRRAIGRQRRRRDRLIPSGNVQQPGRDARTGPGSAAFPAVRRAAPDSARERGGGRG